MSLRKGNRVKHPNKPDWGIGEVLEDSRNQKVRIFFADGGERELSLEYVTPQKVKGSEADNTLLDNRAENVKTKGIRFQSFAQSVEQFLILFPENFQGAEYVEWERDYKVKAHKLMLELLDKVDYQALLENNQYEEICLRAMKVVNKTNLIFPNEKMALKDGIKSAEAQQRFAEDLYSLLYAEGDLQSRFNHFAKTLVDMNADKWPVVSYFLFIRFPEQYMFLKPRVTQNAAAVMSFEINYQSDLNWLSYQSLLNFAEYLKDELAELEPRDMIDVQSFMWCIDPDIYGDYLKEKGTAKTS